MNARCRGMLLAIALVSSALVLSIVAQNVSAQIGGGGGGTGGGVGGGTGFGANGVIVDAEGVLRLQTFEDPNGQLQRQKAMAAVAALDKQVIQHSKLRKVSLTRLEAAIAQLSNQKQKPSEEMLAVAGLTRVQYVFYYPDTKDIVIAGPAEAWAEDLSGRKRGVETGRPIIELQDLVTALRAFPAAGKQAPVIMCSIDPTPEGLSRMQGFLKSIGSTIQPDQAGEIVEGLRTSLGLQKIRVGGVPAETHFAQVLIEADYRMKLIGIGIERPPVKLASYVDRARPGEGSRNALQRWFFVPDYKCVRVTEDNLAMEMVGEGVKLVGEDQAVSSDGSRKVSGRISRASQQFVEGFTRKYPELASKVPVFAQLRNLVDLAVAAAFIQNKDYYGKAGWNGGVLMQENVVSVRTFNTPLQVDTVVTAVFKGSSLMTPIGGGVSMRPAEALYSQNLLGDDEGKVSEVKKATVLGQLKPGQWWWD